MQMNSASPKKLPVKNLVNAYSQEEIYNQIDSLEIPVLTKEGTQQYPADEFGVFDM